MFRRRCPSAVGTGILAAGLLLAACSGGPPAPSAASVTGAPSTSSSAPTSDSGAVSGHSTSSTANSTAAAGLGSPVSAFTAALGMDSGDACGATSPCFGPGLVNGESGQTYEFTNVLVRDGLVLGYDQSFPSRTPLAKAQAAILKYLPPDARAGSVTVATNRGSCGLFDVTSATLAATAAAHPSIGDPSGVVGVKLSYSDTNDQVVYDPQNIQDALVTFAAVNLSEPC